MGTALAGLLILAVLLAASVTLTRTNLLSSVLMGDTISVSTQVEGDRARTAPSIVTAAGDRNNNTLAVTVLNDGATSFPLSGFDKMDVVVFYDSAAQAPLRLIYTTAIPPPAGQWAKTGISGAFEPDVWNPAEILTIFATLVGGTCAPGTVTVGTPNGIIDTSPFICTGLDLTFHSETTDINGATHYQLKTNAPADGIASTVSVVFTEGVTGRLSPTSNAGKFVFPLTGVTAIPAANWDLTYRIKRNNVNMGWIWSVNAPDISIDTVSGTHDGAMDSASLNDSTTDFKVEGVLVGDTISNTTDGSSATVTAITTTTNPNDTLVGALSGGADNDWDTGDAYSRAAPVGVWRDIDLSPFVPVGATGVVVEVVNADTGAEHTGLVRAKEDTRDYMSNPSFEEIARETHRWQMVKLDANRFIQGHVSNENVDFNLQGYTRGLDPDYIIESGVTPDITPTAADKWTTVDLTNWVAADTTGAVLFVDSIDPGKKKYLIREQGGDEPTKDKINPYSNTLFFVGLNPSKHFEIKADDDDIRFYLVAETKGSVGFYVTDIKITDPTEGVWQQMDADDFGIPTFANGLVFHFDGEKDKSEALGFRHGDSTDDWNKDILQDTHYQAVVGLNTDNEWYEYMEDDKFDVWIAGYTRLIQIDVKANVDIIVRQANGAIRTTLMTGAAETANITSDSWQTFKVTFAFPGYTVVDTTDYLEIDLYAEASTNISGESVSVDFRIDDSSLGLTDQMKAAEFVP